MAAPYSDALYSHSKTHLINAWSAPTCPSSTASNPQVYDMAAGRCVAVPASAFSAQRTNASSAGCPQFHIRAGGKCYRTNDCPASSAYQQQCLNTQQVTVRADPFASQCS